jgi:hypothetical protein
MKWQWALLRGKYYAKYIWSIQERREWHISYNHELYQLYKLLSIAKVIKIARLQWAGNLQRLKNTQIPRKLMEWKPEGRRSVEQLTLQWMDGWMV